jgi:hypothetical protein
VVGERSLMRLDSNVSPSSPLQDPAA